MAKKVLLDTSEMPLINRAVYNLVIKEADGVVSKFAKDIKIIQQRLDRIFKKDKRNNKYPSVTEDIKEAIFTTFGIDEITLLNMLNDNSINVHGSNIQTANSKNGLALNVRDVKGNMTVTENHQGSTPPHKTDIKYVAPYVNENLVKVPFVPSCAIASFVESLYSVEYDMEDYGVRAEEGENLQDGTYIVFEVKGESMYPTIQSGSKILCKKIEEGSWEYANGVAVLVYGKTLTVKRILKNNLFGKNELILKADNPQHGELSVERVEIRAMWQAIRIISQKII